MVSLKVGNESLLFSLSGRVEKEVGAVTYVVSLETESWFWHSSPQRFWHHRLVLWKSIFPQMGVGGMVPRRFNHITFIVHFISIIVTL